MSVSRREMFRFAGAAAIGVGMVESFSPASAAATDRGPPASTLPWPPTASFAGKAVVGPHQSSASAMLDQRELLGLPPQSAFIYGNLRDADGNLSEWVRNFNVVSDATKQGLFVQSSAGKDALRALPDVFMAAAPDYVSGQEGESAVWKTPAGAKGKPFRFKMALDGSTIGWREAGVLDITGALLGPGLQWHIPDPEGSELYVSQIYEMTGMALGKAVRGIMAFDKVHLPKGQILYGGKDPLFRPNSHHRTWYTWGTRYRDGSYDAGHFVLGTDRIGFALLTNERGELTLDTDVTGHVDLVPGQPWPKHTMIRTVEGIEWEFLPDPKGTMPDMLGTGVTTAYTPQTEGRWRRVGDKREPAVWFAWGEVAPGDRTKYSRIYRS